MNSAKIYLRLSDDFRGVQRSIGTHPRSRRPYHLRLQIADRGSAQVAHIVDDLFLEDCKPVSVTHPMEGFTKIFGLKREPEEKDATYSQSPA